jgi:hypothetical protein
MTEPPTDRATRAASELRARAATGRRGRIAAAGVVAGLPAHSVGVSIWMRDVPDQSDERDVALCAVASSSLRPSRAFSCRLRPSKSTVPVGCFSPSPSAIGSKTLHYDSKPCGAVAIESPRLTNLTLRVARLSVKPSWQRRRGIRGLGSKSEFTSSSARRCRFFEPPHVSKSPEKIADFAGAPEIVWAHSRKVSAIPRRADGARCASPPRQVGDVEWAPSGLALKRPPAGAGL